MKKYYKQIFEEALGGICMDESEWPQNRTYKLFTEWFDFHISGWVVDLVK